jgi:hypothetical protein
MEESEVYLSIVMAGSLPNVAAYNASHALYRAVLLIFEFALEQGGWLYNINIDIYIHNNLIIYHRATHRRKPRTPARP